MRTPDAEPTLAEFEAHLELAMAGGIISCTAWNAEVSRALDAVRDAGPNAPKRLLDAAMDAFLRQVSGRSPDPWREF
jgi:hypothetical protein